MNRLLVLLLALAATATAMAAHHENPLAERVEKAMAAADRPDADKARDANRKPVETLGFFGIKPGMKVLELIPGGGWYTRLLAPALADGEFYVALGTARVKRDLVTQPGFERVNILEPENSDIVRNEETRLYSIGEFAFGESGFDAVLTFRNMHNFDADSRQRINRAVFDALAPGGLYGVVDHTRRHMEPQNSDNRRRADPVLIIHEAIQTGFEFVGFSDLHYRPVDDLTLEVGHESVTGQTDRFTLLFKKPADD